MMIPYQSLFPYLAKNVVFLTFVQSTDAALKRKNKILWETIILRRISTATIGFGANAFDIVPEIPEER